ncbi:hypothetical protein CHU95_13780 [Niveispirillum lacus]|uniref:Uncharacterized protein n=1 Tax=Niveispirillum lacus TaxID=1981099 RepID=A0A255YW51_9PROT|nr:hypothetical protein CHU95_13780 [Niveispirillum lacus]
MLPPAAEVGGGWGAGAAFGAGVGRDGSDGASDGAGGTVRAGARGAIPSPMSSKSVRLLDAAGVAVLTGGVVDGGRGWVAATTMAAMVAPGCICGSACIGGTGVCAAAA